MVSLQRGRRTTDNTIKIMAQEELQEHLTTLNIPAWCPSVLALFPILHGFYYASTWSLLSVKLMIGTFNICDPCALKHQSSFDSPTEENSRAAKICIKTKRINNEVTINLFSLYNILDWDFEYMLQSPFSLNILPFSLMVQCLIIQGCTPKSFWPKHVWQAGESNCKPWRLPAVYLLTKWTEFKVFCMKAA